MFHGNDREGKNILHGKQLVFQIGITTAGDQYILKIRDRCDLKITEAFKGCDTQGKIGCFVVQRGHHSRKRVRVDLKPYIGKTVLKAFQKGKQEITHGQLGGTDRDFSILICGILSDDFLSLSHLLAGVADLPEKALAFFCHGYTLL